MIAVLPGSCHRDTGDQYAPAAWVIAAIISPLELVCAQATRDFLRHVVNVHKLSDAACCPCRSPAAAFGAYSAFSGPPGGLNSTAGAYFRAKNLQKFLNLVVYGADTGN